MKNTFKILFVSLFLLLYSSVAVLFSIGVSQHSDVFVSHKFEYQKLGEFISPIKFFHTSHSETIVSGYTNVLPAQHKYACNWLFFPDVIANNYNSSISKYCFISLNIIVRFYERDIIFPFHNFW